MVREASKRAAPILSAGALVLDTESRSLNGPSGQIVIERGSYLLLSELMRHPGATLLLSTLAAVIWPTNTPDMSRAVLAVRMRVMRTRKAMEQVGVPGRSLRCVRGVGYRMDGAPQVVRVFSPSQAHTLDRLLRTHPDRAAVRKVTSLALTNCTETVA